ncbi:MAG: 1-(5-phosphoribosyl)-5-[(5-phosphoribosylamino)methylideneamino]imidazole-4-carboxamide isomerase [Methanomicrobiales archaeon]
MDIFPAVDVLDGQCVQLTQGRRETAEGYGDPLTCARRWIDEGARSLHIVNLNGAFGEARQNAEVIRELIRETGVWVQLGGGIRGVDDARSWLDQGVARVIVGTAAIRQPEVVSAMAEECGRDAIMVGVDTRAGEVAIEGWTATAGDYLDWAHRFESLGAGSLLFTNVEREGLCQGIDPLPVQRLLDQVSIPVVAAGGITSIEDIRMLSTLGAAGVVLGSALYRGAIRLTEALEVVA